MMSENPTTHWGNRLRVLLKKQRNLKHLVLANAIGVEESTISRWLSGGNIKMIHLIRLSEYLDVSVDWLILGRGTPLQHRDSTFQDDFFKNLPDDVKDDLFSLLKKLTDNVE